MGEPQVTYARFRSREPQEDGDFYVFVIEGRRHRGERRDGIWHHDVNEPLPWFKRAWFWVKGLIFGRVSGELSGLINTEGPYR